MLGSEDEKTEMDGMQELMDMKMRIFSDQVRQLGALCEEGLLTEEEFTAKKADLLARL